MRNQHEYVNIQTRKYNTVTKKTVRVGVNRSTGLNPPTDKMFSDSNTVANISKRLAICDWLLLFFSMVRQPLAGQGLPISEASRSHSDTPHSVGLFWTGDQPDNTRTALTTHNILAFGRIRTRNPSKRAAADRL